MPYLKNYGFPDLRPQILRKKIMIWVAGSTAPLINYFEVLKWNNSKYPFGQI